MKTKINIQFGILIQLGLNNDHYMHESDPLKLEWFVKVNTFNYLYPFSKETSFEDFDHECDSFKGWADQIKATDSSIGSGTDFYFVCYTTGHDNRPTEIRRIKHLNY